MRRTRAELPVPTEALVRAMRAIAPPPGARARVLRAVEAEIAGRRRLRWGRVALLAPALAAAVAVVLRAQTSGRVPAASSEAVEVAPGRQIERTLAGAKVRLDGPARARWAPGELRLDEGVARVEGALTVACPRCRLRFAGTGRIAVRGGRVEVALYAGRADPVPPETECELRAASEERSPSPPPRPAAAPTPRPAPPRAPSLRRDVAPARAAPPATVAERIRQTAPAQPIVRAPTEIGPLPPAPTPIPMPPAPRKPSDLARQVASYRAARALSGVDDRRALARWRDLSARWPDSPLEPEVEVQIVNALLRLGRRDEALTAAREILRRRPDSSRAAELRALVTAGGGAK